MCADVSIWIFLFCVQEVVFENSVELEYGLNRQTVLRHRSASLQEPTSQGTHRLVEYSVSAPITDYTHYPMDMEEESFGRRTPPPPYDAIVAQTEPATSRYQSIYPKLDEELSHRRGVPKSSSTPLPDGRH